MPAIRSPKGKAADKGQKNKVDPCEICGTVVSRKCDIPRHAKIHAPDAEKLACTWEGCDFRAWQKSNLKTHYRRHIKDRSYVCKDELDCKFESCDPASLLRHRKRMHGYIPRSPAKRKDNKPSPNVPIRVIRGSKGDKGPVASQFPTFSSTEASTSGSSSSRQPMSPSKSLSPSPTSTPSPTSSPSLSPSSTPSPSPPPSRSHIRSLPRPRSYSPLNSSGESEVSEESEVSLPPTPIASTSHRRQLTPEERYSPTVLFMTSPPVYPTEKSHYSLLFEQPAKELSSFDHHPIAITPPLLDCFLASFVGSEILRRQYPEEAIYDLTSISVDGDSNEFGFFPPPPVSPDADREWHEDQTTGRMNGLEGLELDMQQPPLSSFETIAQVQHPINATFIQSPNFPTEVPHQSSSCDGDVGRANGRCSKPSPILLNCSCLELGCNSCGLEICCPNLCVVLAHAGYNVDDMSRQVDDGSAGGNQTSNFNLDNLNHCGYDNDIGSGGGVGVDVPHHHEYANMFDAQGDVGRHEELGLNLLQLK